MTARRLRTSGYAGGDRPRHRPQRGRLSPTNGSVTRQDIHAIHGEFVRGTEDLEEPPTVDEFLVYLLGAIADPHHPPSRRRLMAQRQRERRARERQRRAAQAEPTRLPVRAEAAAA